MLATVVAVALRNPARLPAEVGRPGSLAGIVYLPAILLISIVWGWRLGLLASVASAAAFNFFHIPPVHRFAIADEQNWVALAAFAIAAIVSTRSPSWPARVQSEAERGREQADRALAELAALTRERDRMQAEAIEAEALRRSDELKTALLRSVSHDLRTPLTSIIAAGSALGSPTLTEEERVELSAAIVGEGNRLSRLVENLLDMSRLEAGKAEPHREPVDLAEVLDAAREGTTGPGPGSPRDRARSADGRRRRRAARAGLRQPDRERDPLRRRAPGLGALAGGRGRSSSASSTRGRGSPSATGSGSSPLSSAARRRTKAGRPRPRDRAGFVEANGGEVAIESLPGQGTSFVVSFPAGEPSGGG